MEFPIIYFSQCIVTNYRFDMDGTCEFHQRYSYKGPATHFYYKVHDSSGPLVSDTLYLHKIQTMNG